MVDWDFLKSVVESKAATEFQLYFTLIILSITLLSIFLQFWKLRVKMKKNYSNFKSPFSYFLAIYTGLLLVIINEIIIIIPIIISHQTYTILAREKALLIIIGLGFFIYGWTNVVLYNLSISDRIQRILGFVFLGVMSFYLFAVITTILITFQIVDSNAFLGIGYQASVIIYGTFLTIDLLSLLYIANTKRKKSRYQFWIGLLLFSALTLNFLSIIFNALPLILFGKIMPETHAFLNYIVEPSIYLITNTFSLIFMSWVLFNPNWLKKLMLDIDS